MILADAHYAARFTRMLYEVHLSLANDVARVIQLEGAKRLLDLGGGSGVITFALLRKQPELSAVVVDVQNVCLAGRAIALENHLAERVTYLAGNYLVDDLPSGFDLVMLCDSGNQKRCLQAKEQEN